MPVDPMMAVGGSEWSIPSIAPPKGPQATPEVQGGGSGFGSMLAEQIGALQESQTKAAEASQALATGQTNDVSSVVSAVERAKLSMELATAIRSKTTEAYQEIFRTQV